ncbi:MAG: hypothetical protein U0892_19245 [Pirellulales bacterium]
MKTSRADPVRHETLPCIESLAVGDMQFELDVGLRQSIIQGIQITARAVPVIAER